MTAYYDVAAFCIVLLFFSASTSARQAENYSVILVNSFNESDFEVKMMYLLMTQVSATENIPVLTVRVKQIIVNLVSNAVKFT